MKLQLPITPNYLSEIAQKILKPIKRGESVVVRWFPGHGMPIRLQQILSDKNVLKQVLGSYFTRFLIILLRESILSKNDLPAYFYNIYSQLVEEMKYRKLLKKTFKIR